MRQNRLRLLLSAVAFGAQNVCYAESDAERLLSRVRNQVLALRVFGEKAPTAQFPQGEPPIWGTGFVVGPLASAPDGKQRIITAAHVVQKDDMWAKKGGGPTRTIYPWVLGQVGRMQIEGFRGVSINSTNDIAQVYGPRKLDPVAIQRDKLTADERYFVVSWGLDENWGEPTEEPYVKEIKLVTPTIGDPPIEPGLVLVEIVGGQESAYFKQSESGSPVFNLSGHAVGIMIRERVDATSGLATRGIALPFATVAAWLDGVRQAPVSEPAPLTSKNLIASGGYYGYPSNGYYGYPRGGYWGSPPSGYYRIPAVRLSDHRLAGGCVFLGKFSVRNRNPSSDQVLANAPFGLRFLRKVIALFPKAVPDEVLDQDAVLKKQLAEPELVSIPPRGGVNVRAFCPDVVPMPKRTNNWERNAYYGPVIARADQLFQIRIQRVQRQAYLQDFFYWGEIESVSVGAR
jgi:hypothetical protein